VRRSTKFYGETLGFKIVVDAAPDFALVKRGPWERLASARDPDGYTLEFAQGERAASPKSRKRKKA
jgi:catechol 2,3-dioxygenase-like lactoylglutathione lyase family enzyme